MYVRYQLVLYTLTAFGHKIDGNMARKYTNYDHFCHICGKRIQDGEDYYRCPGNLDVCIPCEENYGVCKDCTLCNK